MVAVAALRSGYSSGDFLAASGGFLDRALSHARLRFRLSSSPLLMLTVVFGASIGACLGTSEPTLGPAWGAIYGTVLGAVLGKLMLSR